MKRFLTLMVVNLVLFALPIGPVQNAEFNQESLSPKARAAYTKLANACVFRVGGVGYGGETSKEELALYDLLEDAHALDALRTLVKTGSYEGGLYGLLGLSIRDHAEFNRAVEVYKTRRQRSERRETGSVECTYMAVTDETVSTQSGCIIAVERRDKVLTAIQSGHYDRMLDAKYRPRNQ